MLRRHILLTCALVAPTDFAIAEESRVLDHQLHAFVAGEVWPAPELGGHGVLYLGYRLDGLPADAAFSAVLNTDTLTLALDDVRIGDLPVRVGGALKGELGFAGLLPDYYDDGVRVDARGFNASYLEARTYLKASLPAQQYVDYTLGGRRWIFSRGDKTSPDLRLPPEAWVLEQRLHYTYWGFERDPSLDEPHRTFPRVRGLGAGVELGLDLRSETARWGAPTDPRNDPDAAIWFVRQWARFGLQAHPRLRIQLGEWAGVGMGEDDLTRVRLGGTNPYVVPLAGVPWAAFLASRYAAMELSAHLRVLDEVEVGPLVDAAAVQDLGRDGSDQIGGVIGMGAFLDLRLGEWQGDLRFGWAPPIGWQARGPNYAIYLSVGRTLL